MNKREVGNKYEDVSCEYLKEKGYKILKRNYQKRSGEIDIIAMKDDIISFVEVKYRKNSYLYTPAEAVTILKQNKIIQTAQSYIFDNNFGCNYNYRFDIIEITSYPKNINHIVNAFTL